MTVQLDLDPNVETSLAAQARARGLSLDAYLQSFVRSVVEGLAS